MPDLDAATPADAAPIVFAGPLLAIGFTAGGSTCALPVPASIASGLDAAGVRRLIGTMEGPGGAVAFNLALLHLSGQRMLMVSRTKMKALGAAVGDTVGVEMAPDPSPDDVPVPDELAAALVANPEAAERFAAMTPGKQRGLVHYVESAKRADTRHTRAAELAHKLATHTLYGDKKP